MSCQEIIIGFIESHLEDIKDFFIALFLIFFSFVIVYILKFLVLDFFVPNLLLF